MTRIRHRKYAQSSAAERACHRTEFCSSSAAQRAVASSSCARSSISAVVVEPEGAAPPPPNAAPPPPPPDAVAGRVAASCQASTSALAASLEDVDRSELEPPVAGPFEIMRLLKGSGSSRWGACHFEPAGPDRCGWCRWSGPRPSEAAPGLAALMLCTAFRREVSPESAAEDKRPGAKGGGGGLGFNKDTNDECDQPARSNAALLT